LLYNPLLTIHLAPGGIWQTERIKPDSYEKWSWSGENRQGENTSSRQMVQEGGWQRNTPKFGGSLVSTTKIRRGNKDVRRDMEGVLGWEEGDLGALIRDGAQVISFWMNGCRVWSKS
jgi:hypothetical protein